MKISEILAKLTEGEGDKLVDKLRPISSSRRPSGRKKMRSKIRKDDFVTVVDTGGHNLKITYYDVVVEAPFRGGDLELFVGKELLKQL